MSVSLKHLDDNNLSLPNTLLYLSIPSSFLIILWNRPYPETRFVLQHPCHIINLARVQVVCKCKGNGRLFLFGQLIRGQTSRCRIRVLVVFCLMSFTDPIYWRWKFSHQSPLVYSSLRPTIRQVCIFLMDRLKWFQLYLFAYVIFNISIIIPQYCLIKWKFIISISMKTIFTF